MQCVNNLVLPAKMVEQLSAMLALILTQFYRDFILILGNPCSDIGKLCTQETHGESILYTTELRYW